MYNKNTILRTYGEKMRPMEAIRGYLPVQTLAGWSRVNKSCHRRQHSRISASLDKNDKIIKVCGIISPDDARLAASAGADLIGMILWPKASRSVSLETARDIAMEAKKHNSEAVGVFVDEDGETISRVCREVGISYAQLHGDQARASFGTIGDDLRIIYVVHADKSGKIVTHVEESGRRPDWYLVDSMKGGSGEAFDWDALEPPQGSLHGWLLAGGLTDENVSLAIETAVPNGVDVSSGVCDASKLKKDPAKVHRYISKASEAFDSLS